MPLVKNKKMLVGAAIGSEVMNREWPDHVGSGRERIISMTSPEFGASNHFIASGNGASMAWPSANKPIAVPFRICMGMTVYQLGWHNGSGTMTDSFDIGIYDSSFNRKVSGGGTARAGQNSAQWVDITDTFLQAGKYYLVGSGNGTTAGQAIGITGTLTAAHLAFLGLQDSATNAYVLPDPLTNMVAAATFTAVPMMMIAGRVPF